MKISKILKRLSFDESRSEYVKSLINQTMKFAVIDIIDIIKCFETDETKMKCLESLRPCMNELNVDETISIINLFDWDREKLKCLKIIYSKIKGTPRQAPDLNKIVKCFEWKENKDECKLLLSPIINKDVSDIELCSVCIDKRKNIMFTPCNHVCVCEECSIKVSSCPICRGDIEKKTKVYI